ncbi:MAG: type 4a pilus biogenesis protein PilO [Candidatus Acidiferrales bacterium]
MPTSFREWPWPLQAVFFLGLAVVLIAAGLYVPGSPVATVRNQLVAAQQEEKPLESEVASLRVYKQRRAELQSEMDALSKQLATLQTIVPEEKQVDQFILMIQSAASSSGVSIRRLKALPVGQKQFYFEMPFEVEADGPYYSVLDFFSKLGRLSRIINVGDIKLANIGSKSQTTTNFHLVAGTSVTGTMTVTTFFSAGAPSSTATTPAAAPVKR